MTCGRGSTVLVARPTRLDSTDGGFPWAGADGCAMLIGLVQCAVVAAIERERVEAVRMAIPVLERRVAGVDC